MPRHEDPTLDFTEIEQLVDTGRSTEAPQQQHGATPDQSTSHVDPSREARLSWVLAADDRIDWGSSSYAFCSLLCHLHNRQQRTRNTELLPKRAMAFNCWGLVLGSFVAGVVIASWSQPSTLLGVGGQRINSLSCQCYSLPSPTAP